MRADPRNSMICLALLVASTTALTACGGGAAQPPDRQPVEKATKAKNPAPRPAGEKQRARPADLRGKVIVLDPGHNGANWSHPSVINAKVDVVNGRKECDTTGTASAAGYTEHAYTWDVSVRLRKILRAHGAKVVMT